jgi:hypothetical protein
MVTLCFVRQFFSNFFENPGASSFEHIEDIGKPFVAAVIGVGNIVGPSVIEEITKEANVGRQPRLKPLYITKIVTIHCDDQISLGKEVTIELFGLTGEAISTSLRCCDHPPIRWSSDVETRSSGGVDKELVHKSLGLNEALHDPLGCRGAADVPETNELNPKSLHGVASSISQKNQLFLLVLCKYGEDALDACAWENKND